MPSRLPSEIELRQRAVEEEEAVSSIVEEVNFTFVMAMVEIKMSMMALKTKRLRAVLSRMLDSKLSINL